MRGAAEAFCGASLALPPAGFAVPRSNARPDRPASLRRSDSSRSTLVAIIHSSAIAVRLQNHKRRRLRIRVGIDASGCLWFYVDVSRTGAKAASQTWADDDLVRDVCAQQRVGLGWGNIPDMAFKVSSKNVVLES